MLYSRCPSLRPYQQKLTSQNSQEPTKCIFPAFACSPSPPLSCAAFALACGGISDPTKGGLNEPVATVSGALTGTSVPANARVALVWRTASSTTDSGGYAVGDDVAVVNGKFTMALAIPAAAYFSIIDGSGDFRNSPSTGAGGGTAPSAPDAPPPLPAEPGSSSSGGGGKLPAKLPSSDARLTPKGLTGGFVTGPLSGAVAGFVAYVDANGNGKLDLNGAYASSTDTILGGNRELVLTYLKDGGALDYEKLRDTSGILPAAGFNLAWTAGKRWMPLNVVQLKLDPSQGLPASVCSLSGSYSGRGDTDGFDPVATPLPAPPRNTDRPDEKSTDAGAPGSSSGSGGGGSSSGGSGGSSSGSGGGSYPSPTDPNLHCSPDGRSFSYSEPVNCPKPPPQPTGLCANGWDDIGFACPASTGWGEGLASGAPVPANWPCPVAVDAGPAPDAGK